MKRNFIIRNVIIAIIVIALIVGGSYYLIQRNLRKYEIEEVKQFNYFVVKEEDKYGVMDRNGNKIIEAKYDEVKIPNPEKAIFACYNDEKVEMLNEQNQQILTKYEKVEPIKLKNAVGKLAYEKSTLIYLEDGKYGLINFEGKKITKPIYEQIEGMPYKEGELLVKKEGKYGVITLKGYELIKPQYDQISVDGYHVENSKYYYAGYIVSNKTEDGYRYGYVNYKGQEILKAEYNQISRITEIEDNENVYLIESKNGQYGVTKNEQEIIENQYQSVEYNKTNNLIILEKSKKYGVTDLEGKEIVPVKYNQIDIVGIYLYAKNDQGTTVYASNGTEAKIETNISLLNTSNSRYKIKISNDEVTKYGVIGDDGREIIEQKYSFIDYLYNDYFIVSNEDSLLGIVNSKDQEQIKIENNSIQKIEGTDLVQAIIGKDRLSRIYNKQMEQICEINNASIEVRNEYIRIYNQEESKYFTKEGKEISNIEALSNNILFAKKENDKWGFVGKDGKFVVQAEYDKVTEFNEYGFAGILKDGKWGSINAQGKVVIEPVYEFGDQKEPSFISKYYEVEYGLGEVYYTNDK